MRIPHITPYPKIWKITVLLCVAIPATESLTFAQRRGSSGGSSGVVPSVTFRDQKRPIDQYERDTDRLKLAEMVSAARKRARLVQIDEDFQRIQVLHNEIILAVRAQNPKYARVIDYVEEMKRRSKRLASNLALPSSSDSKSKQKLSANEIDIRQCVVKLHHAVVSLVKNPMFGETGLLDVQLAHQAGEDLKHIAVLSEHIKTAAENLSRQVAVRD